MNKLKVEIECDYKTKRQCLNIMLAGDYDVWYLIGYDKIATIVDKNHALVLTTYAEDKDMVTNIYELCYDGITFENEINPDYFKEISVDVTATCIKDEQGDE